jgi:hypothetical protein
MKMQRSLLTLFMLVFLFSSTLTAQSEKLETAKIPGYQHYAVPYTPDFKTGLEHLEKAVRQSSNSTPSVLLRTSGEVVIGETVYDLQTNNSVCNRLSNNGDGTFSATWTMGFEETAYPDRGTGFNFFDGNDWGDAPNDRLEADVRTGWPNYIKTNSGTEFICNHVFDAGSYRVHTLRKEAGETDYHSWI